MHIIKQIRQGLIEARRSVDRGEKITRDQQEVLENLISHKHYSIRRQACGLLMKVSKKHRYRLLSGELNPLIAYLLSRNLNPLTA
ncbi:MAG: hypothetical protein ACFFD4_05695 [Candidatus Odinarchaeota archaeon]